MNFEFIYSLWQDHLEWQVWKTIFIGLFFLLCNLFLFLILVYVRREIIFLLGFPKRKKKYLKKKIQSYTVIDRILLVKLINQAETNHIAQYICLVCNFIHILACMVSCVGFVSAIITSVDGWALTLLVFPIIFTLFFSCIFEILPQLIWFPSERRRWKK